MGLLPDLRVASLTQQGVKLYPEVSRGSLHLPRKLHISPFPCGLCYEHICEGSSCHPYSTEH